MLKGYNLQKINAIEARFLFQLRIHVSMDKHKCFILTNGKDTLNEEDRRGN